MPDDGSLTGWNQPAAYDQEVETPYYLSTRFDDSLIQTEFTPTAHSGYFRFTFPSGKPVILLANRQGGDFSSDGNTVSGSETIVSQSNVTPGTMQAFVYGEFSAPVKIQTADSDNGKHLTVTAVRPPGRFGELGIGPQGLGGNTTALAVHIESAWTHITCNPVAVNMQCWRAERRRAKLWADGRVEIGY